MLAERDLLDYDAPLARYWPELATHGNGAITVRTLLNHWLRHEQDGPPDPLAPRAGARALGVRVHFAFCAALKSAPAASDDR